MQHGNKQLRIKPLVAGVFAILASSAAFLHNRGTEGHQAGIREETGASRAAGIDEINRINSRHWVIANSAKDSYLDDRDRVFRDMQLRPELGDTPDSVKHLTVYHVEQGSPAFAAGFRKGDRITAVNGTPIATLRRAMNLIHEISESSLLTVACQRAEREFLYRIEFK